MRTEKELIEICLENLYDYSFAGLCSFFYILEGAGLITDEESRFLNKRIYKFIVRDNWWTILFYDKRRIYIPNDDKRYFFPIGDKEPRRKFLECMLEKAK